MRGPEEYDQREFLAALERHAPEEDASLRRIANGPAAQDATEVAARLQRWGADAPWLRDALLEWIGDVRQWGSKVGRPNPNGDWPRHGAVLSLSWEPSDGKDRETFHASALRKLDAYERHVVKWARAKGIARAYERKRALPVGMDRWAPLVLHCIRGWPIERVALKYGLDGPEAATVREALAPEAGRVELLYHGMDFIRFPRGPGRRSGRDGRDPSDPAIVLSVGRAVAKKGYSVLLDALAKLPPELAWRLVHIGGGPLLDELKRRAKSLAIADRIAWLGARSQQDVLEAYRAADLFVLACRIAADGDRDGLPNVLVEAQSQGLACISTTVSAIPELIDNGETGLLVPPDDPAALARAIERLIRFPDLRVRLGSAGMRRVRSRFSLERGIDRLARRFGVEAGAHQTCESRSMRR